MAKKLTITEMMILLLCLFLFAGRTCGYGDHPCSDYKKLSEADRAATYQKLTRKSDSRRSWKEHWYRFVGKAGDKIASMEGDGKDCLMNPSCGAKFPGYLMKKHPENLQPGTNFEATVCFSKGKTCCAKTQRIKIMRCKDFFIYKLPRSCLKRGRYCGTGVEKKPDCDKKKLLFGLSKTYAAKSCKEIKQLRKDAESGVYWINKTNSIQVYCDMETDGGGWTLVYSYIFTNFREGTGSLVEFKQGSLNCRIIKNIANKCHNYVPDQLILHSAGNPAQSTLGPDLIRSQSSSFLKEYYYFEASTRTRNWPTHDPCGTNNLNHRTDVARPRGNIYIRE
ncbi:uncharacterized protein [Acropora muricata]|uniref:uncharacterized protein isoform X2 n=1 Tax=Acropora muricata TaxID=159855 RepID=UPI0034E58ACA